MPHSDEHHCNLESSSRHHQPSKTSDWPIRLNICPGTRRKVVPTCSKVPNRRSTQSIGSGCSSELENGYLRSVESVLRDKWRMGTSRVRRTGKFYTKGRLVMPLMQGIIIRMRLALNPSSCRVVRIEWSLPTRISGMPRHARKSWQLSSCCWIHNLDKCDVLSRATFQLHLGIS